LPGKPQLSAGWENGDAESDRALLDGVGRHAASSRELAGRYVMRRAVVRVRALLSLAAIIAVALALEAGQRWK